MASRNILTLRAELEEQTKEIQKLQREVEHATQRTINQLSQSNHEKCHKNPAREGTTIPKPSFCSSFPAPFQALTLKTLSASQTNQGQGALAIKCGAIQNGISCPVEEHPFKTSVKDYSLLFHNAQKRSEENSTLVQQHYLRQSMSELNSKVQELLTKNAETDIRCNQSKNQEESSKQDRLQELETANSVQEEMLKQAHAYIDILKEMLQKRDQVHHDIQKAILAHDQRTGTTNFQHADHSNLGAMVVKIYEELAEEASTLRTKLHDAEDHLGFLKKELEDKENNLKQCQEKCDNLLNEHEQEVALLKQERKDARSQEKSTKNQLEIIQEQNTRHEEHIANLESVVSQLRAELKGCKKTNKEKVEELKKQLIVANTSLEKAQTEYSRGSQDFANQLQQLNEALKLYEQQLDLEKKHNNQLQEQENVSRLTIEHLRRQLVERSMEAEHLQVMVETIKEDHSQKEEEQIKTIQEKTASLNLTSCQLQCMKTTLEKMTEELAVKTQSLENAEKSLKDLKENLVEKEKALSSAQDELRKLRAYAEGKKKELQRLQTASEQLTEMLEDTETLKQLLVEKDNMIMTLRDQIGTLTQLAGQQSQKVGHLEEEKSRLLVEVSQRNNVIQNIMAAREQKEARISELEEMCCVLNMEKTKLANECIEKACVVKKLRKEKDESMAELRETQHELAVLTEDYKSMKRSYENRTGDSEATTSLLKMQLKAAFAELAQTKNMLRSVEGCDGHAMKIASRMQKKITAKREQIDALQSRIQFMEEALSNATKEKQHIKLERAKLMQECAIEAAEKSKLSDALDTLKSENTTLKGNMANKEATLDKTLLQLSECQAIIQRLEQEIMCLRLQHTLDLKELKGPISACLSAKPAYVVAPVAAPHSTDVPIHKYNLLFKACPKSSRLLEPSVKSNLVESCDAVNLSDGSACVSFEDDAPVKPSKEPHQTSAPISREAFIKSLMESGSGLHSFSREPLTLHTADLDDKEQTISSCSSEAHILVRPCYTSSPKKHFESQEMRPRSPVHSLLTAPASDMETFITQEKNVFPENLHTDSFTNGEQYKQLTSSACQKLQLRLEYLQTIAEDLQKKNNEMLLKSGNHE